MAKAQPHYEDLGENTPAKRKFLSKIVKDFPNLDQKETVELLTGVKRFVNLVKRLRTEPQFEITYREEVVNGETEQQRVIKTDLEELVKVLKTPREDLLEAMRKLSSYVPPVKKYGKPRKKV